MSKMLVFNSSAVRPHRVAVAVSGNMVVEEVNERTSLIKIAAGDVAVDMTFDQLVQNLEAELETWR